MTHDQPSDAPAVPGKGGPCLGESGRMSRILRVAQEAG